MKKVTLTQKDLKIIHFLWRWKVSTTACIAHFFYRDQRIKTAYERLRKLKKANYVQLSICKKNELKLWTLTPKSFQFVKEKYQDMKELGFKSESPRHDSKANLVQKGIFDSFSTKEIEVVSEQELRRLDATWRPKNVPVSGHRPDGYWNVRNGNERGLVALEVELSTKNKTQYTEIGYFYCLEDEVKAAIWVCEDMALAKRICRVFDSVSGDEEHKNSFIFLQDFVKKNADAEIKHGARRGQSLASVFESLGANRVRKSGGNLLTQSLADYRLSG